MIKALIGAGGFAREIEADSFPMFKFVDSQYLSLKDESILPLEKLEYNTYEVIIAIGDSQKRYKKCIELSSKIKFFTFISDKSYLLDSLSIKIGEGSVICAGAVLTTNIRIGKHAQINLNTTIGHDCLIGDFFTTAPGVNISGSCLIGDRVYIGSNATIKEGITICNDVIIGMNSGVTKSITEPGTYIGCPAKKIK